MNKLCETIVQAIQEKKGSNLLNYDFATLNPFIDTVFICSASNVRQVHAIAENIKDRVKEQGFTVRSMEGNSESRWVLVDLDQVVVHVFLEEERQHFQLEKLYCDLPCKEIDS